MGMSSAGDSFGDSGDNFDYSSSVRAEINVTPLVDVMLVLLVIFMVTAPLLQQGVEVNLPKTTNAPLPGSEEQLVISIDKSGTFFLGAGNKVGIEEIGPKVAAILAKRAPDARKAYIKADAGLQYQVVMDLMGSLYRSGVTQIGLMSAPDTK
jgi:biopolymer transport protein TolR